MSSEIVTIPWAEQNEKADSDQLHKASRTTLEVRDVGFDKRRTAKLLRKIDWNILPLISILILLNFLDRANFGNARLAGLEHSLGMKGLDFNIALAVFFPFFMIAEVPSNIMVKRVSLSLWLCFIMVVWGLCMFLMGFVHNFMGLLFARMALGFTEGGLAPGLTYYITLWYKRHETGFRMALFTSAGTLAGAFGGLLAGGLSEMNGLGGRPGWSWIFIIEGLVTILVAVALKWVMADDPSSAGFLTEEEKEEVKRRLRSDIDHLASEYATKYVFDALKDWRIWMSGFILTGNAIALYSVAFFLPTIVANIGYSHEKAQLMSVPPYAFALITGISSSYAADVLRTRGPFVIGASIFAISGVIMLISTQDPIVQYVGTHVLVCGVNSNVAHILTWNCNNVSGLTKRAVAVAMQYGLGSIAGVISSFSFRTSDAPRYFAGYGLLISTLFMTAILSLIMHIYFTRENAIRDAEMKARGLTLDAYTDEMKFLEREKGDLASFFRYTT